MSNPENAPGWPGIVPRWTSSAKCGVGTAFTGVSATWFTISHGILNEIYYPRMDQAMIRDMEFIVTDGADYFSEEKRDTEHSVKLMAPGVPAYILVNKCTSGRYRIEKKLIADPRRPVMLQKVKFIPIKKSDYHIYVLLAPHIANRGGGNTAWVGDIKGEPALMATHRGFSLAMVSSVPMKLASAGYVGYSDGWQDLKANKKLTNFYKCAKNGNVALVAELDLGSSGNAAILSLGFGGTMDEAGHHALVSLKSGFEESQEIYIRSWSGWSNNLWSPKLRASLYDISKVVLKEHTGVNMHGIIASLSIPWGFSKGDDDLGGYHLVWPRDMVEAAGAFVAIGAKDEVRQALLYLEATQEADGHWPQNMWMDGKAYWNGIQMDESALPILLVDLAFRKGIISNRDVQSFWPMMKRAAGFVVRNGPVSQEDRWEEDPGYTPFTLASEIAALVVAAEYAKKFNEKRIADYLLETADIWNSNIERWIYVCETTLAQQLGIDGYYVRISPIDIAEAGSPKDGFVPIKNKPPGSSSMKATYILSPDALALVRLGLRDGRDVRIQNTVRAIDKLLRTETPAGPSWHRYNDDGYGEHEDGSAFDGTGIGRLWPLLTGERAHFELSCGRVSEAKKLLKTMESFAGEGGLLPEQIWDSHDIPERELFFWKPSGSAMPLVWAHAEYIKLVRSIEEKKVFDRPPQTVKRYVKEKHPSNYASWRFNHKIKTMPKGLKLRIEVLAPAIIHWSADDWKTVTDTPTRDTGLGLHTADLDVAGLNPDTKILFTYYWRDSQRWEGNDFSVIIE
ncbi:MAG TPA: glycoside hydrolase family 15 protein [Candidatus Acidoferrales bacterium]|nr:glycoside hydrolase family 15 protein [Candidatus Acidoferrales bacterium]